MRVTRENQASVAEACWAIALRLKQFGYAEISVEMGITLHHATRIVRDWQGQGRLIAVQSGAGLRNLWKPDPGFVPKPVRPSRSPEQNMWTAMRQMKSFTPLGLLANGATTEEVEVTLEMAQGYCRSLMAAGYLTVARKAVPGRTEAIYRLTRNTGPRPPREKRVRAIIDDNTEAVVVIGGLQP